MLRALLLCLFVILPQGMRAQDLSALARLDAEASFAQEGRGGVTLSLALSQPVPWRARVLAGPPRLVLDFREVDWQGLANMPIEGEAILGLRAGVFRPGWSRLVLELAGPFVISSAELATADGAARLQVQLAQASDQAFAEAAARPEPPEWRLPKAEVFQKPARQPGDGRPLVVVLDPGHGGLDPGAERGGTSEKVLVLKFALALREALIETGGFEVVMTRDRDVFVPLEERVSIARAAGADLFLSLHADALAEGEAEGATIYHLDEGAKDAAAQALAERHDRDDLLAGVDLSAQDDALAMVLIDMARTETMPRVQRLSQNLSRAIGEAGLARHPKPEQGAGFSVLKSPDIPSVLLELGFLSSPGDFQRLTDPAWREAMVGAVVRGLQAWAAEDQRLRLKARSGSAPGQGASAP